MDTILAIFTAAFLLSVVLLTINLLGNRMKGVLMKSLKPMNHRLFKLVLLLAFWVGLEISMTIGHAEVVHSMPASKPVVEYSWPVLANIDHWLYMKSLIGVSFQTTDCNHNADSIDYYDNLRMMPGYVLSIQGVDVTLRTADKHTVVVRTFHLTDQTLFFTEKAMQAHSVDRTYFETHKDGCWVARYCAHCRIVYKLIKVEV
jgi:hypothetical protein